MEKQEVIKVIDEVMNNREIDSIRDAILAIRDKVLAIDDYPYHARLRLRSDNGLLLAPYFEGAKYVVIDTSEKVDTGIYGTLYYE